MHWESPWFLLLIIPLAGVAYLYFKDSQKKRPSIQFSGVSEFRSLNLGWKSKLTHLPTALKFLALFFVILALARPQKSTTRVKKNVEGVDIMIALDVSDSMLIEDMTPENRLEASKQTIKEFIEGRTSDRIGLIVFSGESYTRVPLTLDYKILLRSLKTTTTTRALKMGTAIGVALANSTGRLRESTAKSRVVILLTDGENNSGTIDPETALKIAQGYDIRVYTIGMGRDGQAQLPIIGKDAFGRKTKRYQPIHSKINEELLTKLAVTTGGKFYRAINTDGLKSVFDDINNLEKTKIDVSKFTRYTELFPNYLWWGVFFFLAALVSGKTVLQRYP